ncbi:hypothetical protein GCM10011588_31270 [Nocardia jinanensis]|uniref:Uncharacterized protein n=1 Tax=Nocardia jinanensis TaxID=382504 RepID=A0A917RMC2_9NOCA|nr:hypothetical protein GCM10011588_31270 [Nocardia jinanensis]
MSTRFTRAQDGLGVVWLRPNHVGRKDELVTLAADSAGPVGAGRTENQRENHRSTHWHTGGDSQEQNVKEPVCRTREAE